MSQTNALWVKRPAMLALAAAGALSLAACGEPYPSGKKTAEAMPDTSQPGPTAPDAAETGLVPAEGAAPMQANPPEAQNQPPGTPDVPVDLPEVDRTLPNTSN